MILRVPWRHFLWLSDIFISQKKIRTFPKEFLTLFAINHNDKFIKVLLAVKFK